MKAKLFLPVLLSAITLLTNCKKDQINTDNDISITPTTNRSLATASVSSIKVETLYGKAGTTPELVDGRGAAARFANPQGLQLMPDGIIYVADMGNNTVRKISADGNVSTIKFKPATNGQVLLAPKFLGVEHKTGIIHLIQNGNSLPEQSDYIGNQLWIFKNNGDFVATSTGYYQNPRGMARDPYTDTFYYSYSTAISRHVQNPNGGIYGERIFPDSYELDYPEALYMRGFSWDAVGAGYNKVIYFSYGDHLYKHTPSGVTKRLFRDMTFRSITSIILSKDSRTMYLADAGYIRRIDGEKLTTLAGPTGSNDGRDGPAKEADVYAVSLALAPGENAIYFNDSHANTIRKISLK